MLDFDCIKRKVGLLYNLSSHLASHWLVFKFTRPNPNIPIEIYSTKFILWGLKQIYQTKSIEPNLPKKTSKQNLQNQNYEAICLKGKEPNMPN